LEEEQRICLSNYESQKRFYLKTALINQSDGWDKFACFLKLYSTYQGHLADQIPQDKLNPGQPLPAYNGGATTSKIFSDFKTLVKNVKSYQVGEINHHGSDSSFRDYEDALHSNIGSNEYSRAKDYEDALHSNIGSNEYSRANSTYQGHLADQIPQDKIGSNEYSRAKVQPALYPFVDNSSYDFSPAQVPFEYQSSQCEQYYYETPNYYPEAPPNASPAQSSSILNSNDGTYAQRIDSTSQNFRYNQRKTGSMEREFHSSNLAPPNGLSSKNSWTCDNSNRQQEYRPS
jgi:hypothetical protein